MYRMRGSDGMGKYIIRRLVTAIPTLIAISIVLFAIISLAPGDPLAAFAADPRVPEEVKANIRKQLGLADPLPVQYAKWAKSMATGQWGTSFQSRSNVRTLVWQRLPATLAVLGTAFVLSLLIAIPIGILSAIKQYSVFDQIATIFAYIGNALPTFVSGLFLIIIFGVKLKWFPFIYRSNIDQTGFAGLMEHLRQAALPVAVLTLFQTAGLMRYTRASMLEAIRQDYVRTARAKGLRENKVLTGHAMRNALIPVVTIVALQIPGVFGGAVVTEQIFRVPGMGSLLIGAITNKDTPVIMAVTFIFAVLVVLCNLLADVVYGLLDPRIKYS
jgi:peptide/nickel transport system permease protein